MINIRKFGDMKIRKTKLNRGLLLKLKPKSCVANKTTLRLSLKFKTDDPVLSKRKRGAKIKKSLQTFA